MSGRETVRSYRDNGRFEAPRQQPAWLGTAAFGFAAIALAALAFFGVQLLMPGRAVVVTSLPATTDVSFSDIQPSLKPATGATASPLTSKQAALTQAESKACSRQANAARDNAVTSEMRSRSNEVVLEYVRQSAGNAGFVQCLGTTRPARLCNSDERDGFLFFAQAAASRYDGAVKMSGLGDAELKQLQAHNPVMGRQSLATVRADFARMIAAEQQALKSIQRTVFGLTSAGLVPVDALTAHLGFDTYDATWRALVADAPHAPSVCAS
ncbi:MAG: hypothetical protein ABI697_12845 [Devosia sp.]